MGKIGYHRGNTSVTCCLCFMDGEDRQRGSADDSLFGKEKKKKNRTMTVWKTLESICLICTRGSHAVGCFAKRG